MSSRKGKQTFILDSKPHIAATASIVGKKEGEGPLRNGFDVTLDDDIWGEKTWEKAESKLQRETVRLAIEKRGIREADIDCLFAGDLLNQCVGAHYGLKDMRIPFFGLYGACSTFCESMALAAMMVDAGFSNRSVCVTSSHFCSAEKQFRLPLDYGGQRTPTSQWTVTGSGAAIIEQGDGINISSVTAGRIVDMGISDANNMGAAMAPAAKDTLMCLFEDTGTEPKDYDLILTGDLGVVGTCLLYTSEMKNHIMPSVNLTGEQQGEIGTLRENIDTYKAEMQAKFIMGIEPIENFEQYRSELKKREIDKYVSYYQDAYDRYLQR